MEKSKSKTQRRAVKTQLKAIGQLAMPEGLLPWERDLLAVLLEAIDGSTQQEEKADAPSPEMLLRGLVRCGKCGSSYTLESSGKKVNGEVYQYRYYNCRTACRAGKEACPGGRVPARKLDSAVLEFIVGVVCTGDRCAALLAPHYGGTSGAITEEAFASVQEAWSTMIRSDPTVARNYLHHLVEQIEVDENRITVVPKEAYRMMA